MEAGKNLFTWISCHGFFTLRAVKLAIRLVTCWILLLPLGICLAADDASIDRLLSKLPPPEKLIKPSVQKALQQHDPAFKDSLVPYLRQAFQTRNFPAALRFSRKLVERYPRSAGAQCFRGIAAYDLRQFGEASAAFRTAKNIQPTFAFAHFGLAAVEASQRRYASAIPHLQRLIQLEPKASGAYYALSDCMLEVGRKQESANYAKKATALAPSNAYMWLQLAKAEKSLGHTEGTLNAIAKAAQVSPDNGLIFAVLGFSYINLNRFHKPSHRCSAPRNFCPTTISSNRSSDIV